MFHSSSSTHKRHTDDRRVSIGDRLPDQEVLVFALVSMVSIVSLVLYLSHP
jgi:hypothetical protein